MINLTKVEEAMTVFAKSGDFIIYKVEDEKDHNLVLPDSTEE